MVEIEDNLDIDSIYFSTETHRRDNGVRMGENIKCIHKTREIQDKKGGGLMMLWQSKLDMVCSEIYSTFSDILITKSSIGNFTFFTILVYMSVTDFKLNQNMSKEIIKTIDSLEDENILLLGDFNAHIDLIGYQKLNKNGEQLLNILDRCNLIMMNLEDNKTVGAVTWERETQKSTIDYVLVDFSMYDRIKSMVMDDTHEILKISDHNLICINIEVVKKKKCISQEYEVYEYLKISDNRIEKLIELLRGCLIEIDSENMEKFEECLKECCLKI